MAEIIGAGPRAPRLAENLETFGFAIHHKHREEVEALTRKELLSSLEEAARAAGTLTRILANTTVMDALAATSGDQAYLPLRLLGELPELTLWAKKAAAQVHVGQAGKSKAKPAPEQLSAAAYCAVVLFEAWKTFTGTYPGIGNQDAHDAASLLWLAATGRQSEITDWRYRFGQAKAFVEKSARDVTVARFITRIRETLRAQLPASQSPK